MRAIYCPRTGETAKTYSKYLRTKHWREFRQLALMRAGDCCEKPSCHSVHDLQVHHLFYKTLGQERLCDVRVLCGVCHAEEHDRLRRKGGNSREDLINIGRKQALYEEEWLELNKPQILRIVKNASHPNNVINCLRQAFPGEIEVIRRSPWFQDIYNRKRKSRGMSPLAWYDL